MTRGSAVRWWAWPALILGMAAGCDDPPAEPDQRVAVTVTGVVRLDGTPAFAHVTLEDLSVGPGISRTLVSDQTDVDGRYTLQAEVDADACGSLYVSALVVIVREGASGQVGASEPTRGCGAKTLDLELTSSF